MKNESIASVKELLAYRLVSSVLVKLITTLVEKGVLTIEDVEAMATENQND